MRKTKLWFVCLLLITTLSEPALAQKKLFTYEQAFRSASSNIIKPLPVIRGWVDDDNYLELRKDDSDAGKMKLMAVNVKTGKATAAPANLSTSNEITTPSAASLGLDSVNNVTLSPDGKFVAYTQKNDLFIMNLASKSKTQITSDGSEDILNGYASWIYFEEILGRASRYKAFWWSPDSKKIAFMRFDQTDVLVFPLYVATGQRGYLENTRYPKPGDKNPEVKIGITAIDQPEIVWADFNQADDQYFGPPIWTPSGQFWVQWMNRDQTNLKIFNIDLTSGKKNEVYDEKQKTWIDLDEYNRIEFLASGKGFILKSDRDGWENLYLHDAGGKLLNQVTTGKNWGTSIVKIDEKNKVLYYRARKENSARYDFYKVGLDGNKLTRLSFGDFSHDQIHLSPNAKHFITTYSNVHTPTTVAIVNGNGKLLKELGNNKGPDFDAYALPKTEIIRVKSGDSVFALPVAITYPVNFDSTKKYPVLISIYGGPNAGTVYDRWRPVGGAGQWWAQEGIIQVAIDNRSSGHFGKEGLNYIHRQLGKWEIEDYMAAGKWLRSRAFIDSTKIAITGGSFGGYLTCMALTYGAEVFTHGIANASVTDWQLYDSHYTERFMDTPGDNPEGYRNTSVMTHADKLKGVLRIVHGTSDDNVHMQNSIQLIDKLQDLNKHFEFMLYPNERHGIGANKATKRQHNTMEAYRFYYQYLIGKPMPEVFYGRSGTQRRAF